MYSIEDAVLKTLQGDLPLDSRPFNAIAQQLGLPEEEVICIINSFLKKGVIRRVGAVLGHRALGFAANAMILWAVAEEQVQDMGRKLSSFPEVTHCYHRQAPAGWNYNIFTMVHAPSREICLEKIKTISQKTGLDDYQVLFSTIEFKKTSISLDL